ncbi:hypothetical protein QUF74_04810 [Candidatus Halobeggiatoa sp. HSG11]|nr:hypothetical protein [Candidatus Halobeggiatoa sp. HSG11]
MIKILINKDVITDLYQQICLLYRGTLDILTESWSTRFPLILNQGSSHTTGYDNIKYIFSNLFNLRLFECLSKNIWSFLVYYHA